MQTGILGLVNDTHSAPAQSLQNAVMRYGLANQDERTLSGEMILCTDQPSQRGRDACDACREPVAYVVLLCGKNELIRNSCRAAVLHSGHALGGLARCAIGGSPWLLWRIFRGTLGLKLFGMKHAVAAKAAIGKSLRAVFESIGWRFGAVVDHWKRLIILYQYEFNPS